MSAGRESASWLIGELTISGTLGIVFQGAFVGIFGGLIYAVMRPWLTRLGRWRGMAFGLALLLAFGAVLFDADPDRKLFRRYGAALLNVALFAALFPIFGLIVAPLTDRFARPTSRRRPRLRERARGVATALAAFVAALLVVWAIGNLIGVVVGGARLDPLALGVSPLAAGLAARALVALAPRARAAAYLLVASPALVGLPFTVRAVAGLIAP